MVRIAFPHREEADGRGDRDDGSDHAASPGVRDSHRDPGDEEPGHGARKATHRPFDQGEHQIARYQQHDQCGHCGAPWVRGVRRPHERQGEHRRRQHRQHQQGFHEPEDVDVPWSHEPVHQRQIRPVDRSGDEHHPGRHHESRYCDADDGPTGSPDPIGRFPGSEDVPGEQESGDREQDVRAARQPEQPDMTAADGDDGDSAQGHGGLDSLRQSTAYRSAPATLVGQYGEVADRPVMPVGRQFAEQPRQAQRCHDVVERVAAELRERSIRVGHAATKQKVRGER